MPVRVVHATAHEIVALKPAGLPGEAPRNPAADSLVRRLETQGWRDLRLVHRLDSLSCGLLLVAASQPAAAHYAAEIEARRWHKWYVARLGVPPTTAAALVGSHTAYLKREGRRARVVRAGGKASFLDIVSACAVPDQPRASHVLIRLHSGRYHQIRAMLTHLGAPLAGDDLYGGARGRFYLEHVLLGVSLFEGGRWSVWQAPGHQDRDRWAPDVAAAVESAAATARTSPPTPAPMP